MGKQQKKGGEGVGAAVVEPRPPFAEKHLEKPGLESEVEPRPRYAAPQYRPAGKLRGKVALVTGGDSGIGRAVAVMYAREGADVAFTYLPVEQSDADETRAAIEKEGRRALLMSGDLTDREFCQEVVAKTVSELGRLDIVVNNAAYQQSQKSPEDVTDEQWAHTFETNIYAYFRIVKAALPHLPRGGAIINTGSSTGLRGSERLLDYSATKGAILAFTKSLSKMVLDRGIRVNCISPGPVWTPLNPADLPAKEASRFGAHTPMGRPAQPEEIAPAYVYFASEADSSYVTGETLTLLGGETLGG
jgi:NAD(P)-dependent dehydrogenase (short-subunit alcohol dehydrogenase family)